MLNVALTGNIAAGKSTVVDLFRRWGATIIDADQLVREVQAPGTEVIQAIALRFGRGMILPTGELDRKALRARVMGDDAALADLNAIVHPAVRRERDRLLVQARDRGDRIVINDIPLLFEAADPAEFDLVILVDAPEPVRLERLIRIRGMAPEAAAEAISAQQASDAKRSRSDFIIDNNGTLADLERAALRVWDQLQLRTEASDHP
jgi:dephospho-CoA kinase